MSKFPEIRTLFAALASNLRTPDLTAGNQFDVSIPNLNSSLNPSDAPTVRILDTVLSLMHFTAPQVQDSVIEFTLKSIITVLSSSVECKVARINDGRVLRVGGLIPKSDCASVMEECAHILEKFDGTKGGLCGSLLYNIFRVAALAMSDSNPDITCDDSFTAFAHLLCHIPKQCTFETGEIPLRLLLWHLDPFILKQDVTQILQEFSKRAFLSLKMEIYERLDWRSIMICLVISPSMFMETRTLLQKWFLMTGLASLMELQSVIVGHVLDILSRPMWWGLSLEVGSKLPFSLAYFPYEHHLLRILTGPISQKYFKHLLQNLSGSVSHAGGQLHRSLRKTATNINSVDHRSMWAMVMNFPNWLSFASMMIFCNSKNIASMNHDMEATCPAEAAKFIAWILYPMSEPNQRLMVDYLVKTSAYWSERCCSLNISHEVSNVHKETKNPKLLDKNTELDSWSVSLWLNEFTDMYIKLFGRNEFCTSNSKGFSIHQHLLWRRIPLGIVLLHPSHVNAEACSLLLHYAATGNVQEFSGIQNSRQGRKRWKHDSRRVSMTCIQQCTKAEAVAGCRTVFDITDVAESISESMFAEDEGLNFVCLVKTKTCSYLLQCIKRLLLLIEFDEDGLQMRRDLLCRVIRWMNQGKDVFKSNKDLDSICEALNV